ncbi:MAG TPA: HEAT repeat domain-containing protein [Blastocatellia bacterium]|nr:HEAT repeat domain-containing protein [Blastocatellia bacterium]
MAESLETEFFIKRWTDEKYKDYMDRATWAFIHDYSDKENVDQTLETMTSYFEALDKYQKGDPAPLKQLGGVKAFKDKFAALLSHRDQSARGFAAIVLGICGDRAYAPRIAKLAATRRQKRDYRDYDRGLAAIALGFLEAKEHAKTVALLLKDKNPDIRNAATESLKLMGATELIK